MYLAHVYTHTETLGVNFLVLNNDNYFVIRLLSHSVYLKCINVLLKAKITFSINYKLLEIRNYFLTFF